MTRRSTHEPSAAAGGSSVSADRPPAVIGLAHGSRHPHTRTAIESLMARVGDRLGTESRAAFLDLTDPDLETVTVDLAAAGTTRAVVVPLLFTEAFHATVDVPEAVEDAARTSGVELRTADILGTAEDVAAVLLRRAADLDRDASLLLFAVGSSRPEANAAVAALADRLAEQRARPVRAAFGTVDPRASVVLDELDAPIAVLPLFLAPGLLLDPMAATARERGWGMAAPLGDLATDLVADRYRHVVV